MRFATLCIPLICLSLSLSSSEQYKNSNFAIVGDLQGYLRVARLTLGFS